MTTWHVITPEFPPSCGGVGDYTSLLAAALTGKGDRVYVWHPGRLPDRFGRSGRDVIEKAWSADAGTILVEYVPSAFGRRGLNVPFCLWLSSLRRRGADVRIMFHEPFFYFGFDRPWRNGLAIVQRLMAAILLRAATRAYYSTEAWTPLMRPYGPQEHVEILPIPATIPVDVPPDAIAAARRSLAGVYAVGHFGTYGEHVVGELVPALRELHRRLPSARVLLAGRGAAAFVQALEPALASHVGVVETDDGGAIAAALRTCDVLMQPYPDGVTTRRTSMMAALTTGLPVVTTQGRLTERVWIESDAVTLVPAGDGAALAEQTARLVEDADARRDLGARGRRLYDERFAMDFTVTRLRRA